MLEKSTEQNKIELVNDISKRIQQPFDLLKVQVNLSLS
jgi:hypothetical protein